MEIANSTWMDPDKRYLRSGVIELIFRQNINFQALSDLHEFCDTFDVPKDDFIEAVKGDGVSPTHCLNSFTLATKDRENIHLKRPREKVWKIAAIHAENTKNDDAFETFSNHVERFDTISNWLGYFGIGGESLFERYHQYHVWSRWHKVLFLSPCSKVSKQGDNYVMEVEYRSDKLVSVQEDNAGSLLPENFLNDSRESDLGKYQKFALEVFEVLTLRTWFKSVRTEVKNRSPVGILFRLFDGILEWIAYAYQVFFPFSLIGFLILLLKCY